MGNSSAFDLTEAEIELLDRRQRVLLPLAHQYRPPRADTLAAAKQLRLSYRMVRHLIQRYRSSNDPLVFLTRRTGRRVGTKSLPAIAEQVIRQAFEREFAKRQKPHVEAVYRSIKIACSQRGIAAPSLSSVRRRFADADPVFVARRREGKAAAQKLKPVTGERAAAQYPLHEIQMDHTKADVILVDSVHRKPIGRPWVTFALDLYSRCIAGFYVSLEAPSATTVGLCLANVAQDKDVLLAQHQINASWPLAGKPALLHTDNGKDFVSRALKQGCLNNGIRLEQRPLGKPWYGGSIERVIGTFMSKAHDEIPGTTFSSIAQRGEYDPEANACMTLREFERWLLLQIVEYHNQLHRGIGEAPLHHLTAGLEAHGQPPPVKDLKTYVTDFLPIVRRRIRRDGFHLDHIAYYDPKLDYYIARRGSYPAGFELRRDPRNLRFIWMRLPDQPGYMEIPFRRLTNPDITLWEHQEALKLLRERNARLIDEQVIFGVAMERRETLRKASLNTKRARRNTERVSERGPHLGSAEPPPLPSPSPQNERKTPLEAFEVEFE